MQKSEQKEKNKQIFDKQTEIQKIEKNFFKRKKIFCDTILEFNLLQVMIKFYSFT